MPTKELLHGMFWDGSSPEAYEIILWVEKFLGVAEYKETNETVHRKHPEIRIHTPTGKKALNPGEWLIKNNDDEFFIYSPERFDKL